MVEINGTGGLCMTCNNQPTCYYHARRGPALFCELFDNFVPSEGVRRFPDEELPEPSQALNKDYAGLCMNCDHRTECMHPKPESGVWHCEDYD
jgi:hypothetical protein